MAIVTYYLPKDPTLTPEEIADLEALDNFEDPMDDPDCPPTPDHILKRNSMLRQKYRTNVITKEILMREGFIKA